MSVPVILGKKVGMTQVYDSDNKVIPVTVVEAGPCVVLRVCEETKDGYESIQVGFDEKKPKNSTKALIGHCGKAGTTPKRFIREFRIDGASSQNVGDVLTVESFEENEVQYVDVAGISKGRGFAGVMKRHGFGGQSATHGTKRRDRSPGSISSYGAQVGRSGGIRRGKKMAGHMGNEKVTVRNQKLVSVKKDKNIMLIRGSIPGAPGGYLMIRASKTKS